MGLHREKHSKYPWEDDIKCSWSWLIRQVQDNHLKGLHAWSLWRITWWTSEVEYKAKLPTFVYGRATWRLHQCLAFNLGQGKTSTSSSSERLESKVLVPLMLVLWNDDCRCQNRRISSRGSRTVSLGQMVTGGRGHEEVRAHPMEVNLYVPLD